ncbi:threonine aldolase [Fistulifera solaris]|uniref:Threonine aldolase n=1 Tax=Fistulifera solaris TaxID=1519565 RepID=A0A1Z5JJB1_FISSO|nr:threonine aldolase [Fistulifera solaris]|eukprot:GAX14079.1 threonine aldolase [Fistulifera solaris]
MKTTRSVLANVVQQLRRKSLCRRRKLSSSPRRIIDLRSDTVTLPSPEMIKYSLNAPLGDDVMGEDPTVQKLQQYVADMLGFEAGLFLPTGTMANLVALTSHCLYDRAAEVMIGAQSHISLWEGGNAAIVGGIHTRQLPEDRETAQISEGDIRDFFRDDSDDHCSKTVLLCLENTHNMLGGVALPVEYMAGMSSICRELGLKLHVDGARLANAAVAQGVSIASLCAGADSVSLCLSKGLGAPVGSVLVGDNEFIRLAKRARKRCGGGMRQAGVVASMGLYALENNVERLSVDHYFAKQLAAKLENYGFQISRAVETNIFYFSLPESVLQSKSEYCKRLEQGYGIKITGGYSTGGKLFRVVTHLGVSIDDVDYIADSMVKTLLNL